MLSCSVMTSSWNGLTCQQRWGPAFDGLHIMTGFKDPAGVATGFTFDFPKKVLGCINTTPMPIVKAWFAAASAHNTGTPAAMGPVQAVWVTTPSPAHLALISDVSDYYWGQGPVGPKIRWQKIKGWWYQ